jgi:hypothetical protein
VLIRGDDVAAIAKQMVGDARDDARLIEARDEENRFFACHVIDPRWILLASVEFRQTDLSIAA